MVKIDFFTFAKKQNSTKQPIGGERVDCEIKEPFDLLNPVLILRVPDRDPIGWNYAYISAFSRYYYITDWNYERGRWFASLAVDALASWRDEVGKLSTYILRSSNTYNTNIADSTYPATDVTSVVQTEQSLGWSSNVTNGTYVVGIINGDTNALGAISYYVFTQSEINTLCGLLMNQADWLNINPDEISPELTKALFNPFQYITSCMWYPFAAPSGASITSLKFGWWDFNVSCKKLASTPVKVELLQFAKPIHPQSYARGSYLNLSPYTRLEMFVPPWGDIPLDTTIFIGTDVISAGIYVDCISGVGGLRITTSSGGESSVTVRDTGYLTTQVGVPIQLAQMAIDYMGAASTAINAVGSVVNSLSRLDVGGAISNLASGIDSAVKAAMPQLQTNGSNGSLMAYLFQPHIRAQFFYIVNEDLEGLGRPLCQIKKISDIPGYVLCRDGHFDGPCSAIERQTINDALTAGFFYE